MKIVQLVKFKVKNSKKIEFTLFCLDQQQEMKFSGFFDEKEIVELAIEGDENSINLIVNEISGDIFEIIQYE